MQKTIHAILGRETVHPFPARMAPDIALRAVSDTCKPLRVLDPMMGSGTVLAVARSKGHHAIGVDTDPLAVLISKVWTTSIDDQEVRTKAVEVLARARERFRSLSARSAYPPKADKETRDFAAYWFDAYARRQLASLAFAIDEVLNEDVRDALWCAFSRLIIAKQAGASLALDLAHSRPHKKFDRAPTKPFSKFMIAVDRVLAGCINAKAHLRGPRARALRGDARQLQLSDASIDLVLTSPPYLNAIDYMRCSKFSLVWMNYNIGELRKLRTDSVGSEAGKRTMLEDIGVKHVLRKLKLSPTPAPRDQAVLARYIDDIRLAMHEVARVLVVGGTAVYVVGENTVRGTYVRNSAVICALAEQCGLQLSERRTRELPGNRRYMPPPQRQCKTDAMDGRMRREVVLTFSRTPEMIKTRP